MGIYFFTPSEDISVFWGEISRRKKADHHHVTWSVSGHWPLIGRDSISSGSHWLTWPWAVTPRVYTRPMISYFLLVVAARSAQ